VRTQEGAEMNEDKQKRGKLVTSDRKTPPFAEGAKDGHPQVRLLVGLTKKPQPGMAVPPEKEYPRGRSKLRPLQGEKTELFETSWGIVVAWVVSW